MSSSKELLDRSLPVRGFGAATFGLGSTVFFSNADTVQYLDLDADEPSVTVERQTGEVTVLSSAPDHTLIGFAVFDGSIEGGAAIRVLDASTLEPLIDVSHHNRVVSMCFSQGNEAMVAISLADDDVVKFSVFDLKTLKQSAHGELIPTKADSFWEVSFCPADEGIVCCFGGGTAYLLRVLNGYVDKFSQINFEDVTCHSWASDVTMAFGTTTSSIRLYRETLPLQVVELSDLYKQLLDHDMPSSRITIMTFTMRKFAVQTQSGILLVFLMLEGNPQWDAAIAIVLTETDLRHPGPQILGLDQNEDCLVYSTGNQLLVSSLRHVKNTMKNGGRMVTARHLAEITDVAISEFFVATLDKTGLIILSSRATNRVLSFGIIQDAIAIFFSTHRYQMVAVRKHFVTTVDISFQSLEPRDDLLECDIVYCATNESRSLVAIFQEDRFDLYRTEGFSVICGSATNLKKGITKAVFSDGDEFLTVLGKNDQIFVFDTRTGELAWNAEQKLQFYTDVAHVGNNVFALNRRFGLARFRNGKELGTLSMHTPAIGYTSSSLRLAGRDSMLFLGTACGQILASRVQDVEEPFLILNHCHRPLSHLSIRSSHLVVGSRNGCVVIISLEATSSIPEHTNDLILWPYNRIFNFTYLLQEIDLERNLIRRETETFVKAYTERRDAEVERMRDEYERSLKSMKERVKKIEDAFEQSEQDKHVTIQNLKKLYEDEFALQESNHDTMIREHIKGTLRQAEQHEHEVTRMNEEFEATKRELIASFHTTEQRLIVVKEKMESDFRMTRTDLEKERELSTSLRRGIEELRSETEQREENLRQRRREEVRILEGELWNEKATCAQLNVQRDRAVNELSAEKTTVMVREERIEELEGDLRATQAKCSAVMNELEGSRKNEENQRAANKKLTISFNRKTEEFEELAIKAHRTERRLRDIEAKLDEISHCVYDKRKLEHMMLGLLAFINDRK